MSENKKSVYVDGIRFFKANDNAPNNLKANGFITPNKLVSCLKSDVVQDAKSEYNGDVQYKVNLWENEDGSYSMSFNTWKPEEKETKEAQAPQDLPW